MKVDHLSFHNHVLTVKCSGKFGVGSDGNCSGILLRESIENWMLSHPEHRIDHLVIDYTNVEYEWGDGPVSSVMPFLKHGIAKIHLLAGPRNLQPLLGLVGASGNQWFVVEGWYEN